MTRKEHKVIYGNSEKIFKLKDPAYEYLNRCKNI